MNSALSPALTLIGIEEPRRAGPPPAGFALWQLGFRPFYLAASVFAAGSIALWALQFTGVVTGAYLAGPAWHAHEMLFGFTLAVVVGFLFTAGRNWSNRPTPTGATLAALVALWAAGRVLVLTPFGALAAIVDSAFAPAAALALAIPFWAARNRRNYFFVGLLVLLGAANALFHLSQLGLLPVPAFAGLQLALDVVLFIVAVMAGRVVPMFTNNGVRGANAQRQPAIEKLALASLLVLLLADLAGLPDPLLAVLCVFAAAAHATRWALWKPWATRRAPLVWVLHAAYAWVPVHLALRAMAAHGWVPVSAAAHALTVGAIGGLIIGMMVRTTRGHTGRMLVADRFDVAMFAAVLAAGVVRVALPLAVLALTLPAVVVSAALWSIGFALFAWRYGPVLLRPRLDGKPG